MEEPEQVEVECDCGETHLAKWWPGTGEFKIEGATLVWTCPRTGQIYREPDV